MIDIKIDTQIPKALEILKTVEQKQWPFLMSYAANNTAKTLVPYLKTEMQKAIDNPIPFTLNSLWARYGNKGKPEASVEWRTTAVKGTAAGKYLRPLSEAGQRKQKRFESALSRAGLMPNGYVLIPTDSLPKDQHGNVAGGGAIYNKILSYLRANPDAMQNRRIAKLSRMKTSKLVNSYYKGFRDKDKIAKREARAKAKAARYVVFGPNNDQGMYPGIWERTTTMGGKQNSRMRLLFAMRPSVSYRKTFPFYELMTAKARELFPSFLTEAIEKFKPRK